MTRDIVMCGLNLEMEIAKKMGGVGKCSFCLFFDQINSGDWYCRLYDEVIEGENTDCKGWVVDHR